MNFRESVMFRPAILIALFLVTACGGPGKLPGTKVGKPYVINGESYYPSYDPSYDKTGTASWYGPGFHGKYTASGEVYDQNDLTAAHPTLPMPSLVRVTNLENGKSLVVRINDRGPFKANRLIDLSKKSARTLGIHSLAQVRVQFLEQETQNYIAMAKAEGSRIIPMAEYHRRVSGEVQVAAQSDSTDTNAVPAPMMTVGQNDIAPGGAPVVESNPAESKVKIATPRLFVQEARADEIAEMLPRQAPEEETAGTDNDDIFQPDSSQAMQPQKPVQPEPIQPKPLAEQPLDNGAPVAAAESFGDYTIQAGVFSSEENVHKLVEKLQPIGETLVDQVEMGGRTLWRVRLGGFVEKNYASEVLEQVRAIVPDAKVVRK